MKLKLLICTICLVLFSCETIKYDGETRFVTTGKVVDSNGNPLAGISVLLTNYNSGNSFNNLSYTIGKATTDANGNFVCITPKATNAPFTEIEINTESPNGLQVMRYSSILNIDYQDFKINLSNIVLRPFSEVVSLGIVFNRSNSSNFELDNYEVVQENQSSILYNNPFPSNANGTSNSSYFNQFSATKNTTVFLKYTKTNRATGVFENIEVPITVGDTSLQIEVIF